MLALLNFRTFVIIVSTFVFIVLFYYYNDSLDTIVTLEREKSKCQQGVDTISAQLQVVYEHKSRLEKSFQQEKENFAKFKTDQDRSAAIFKQKFDGLKKQIDDVRLENNKLTGKYDKLKLEKQRQSEEHIQNLRQINDVNSNLKNSLDALTKEIEALRKKNVDLRNRLQLAQQNTLKLDAMQSVPDLIPVNPFYVASNNISTLNLTQTENDVLRSQKDHKPKLEQLVLQRPQNEPLVKIDDKFLAQEKDDVANDVVFERHRPLHLPEQQQQQSVNVLPAPDLNRHVSKRIADSDKANEEDAYDERAELPMPVPKVANEQYVADIGNDFQR